MDNITFLTDIDGNEHVIIDRGNGEYTSMPKSVYDDQQAALPKDTWVEPQLTK